MCLHRVFFQPLIHLQAFFPDNPCIIDVMFQSADVELM